MKAHNYVRPGKFKNVNCPYALVRGIVFPSIYAAQERFRSNWNSLRADCHAKTTARNEAQARHDMLLSMYQDEATEALGKSNGFYSGMVLLQTYITTLENVLML